MPAQLLLYPYETVIALTDATTRIFPHQSLLSGETRRPQASNVPPTGTEPTTMYATN